MLDKTSLRINDDADMTIFYQLFVGKVFRDLKKEIGQVDVLIDAHAHIGLFSKWALMKLGVKTLIAMEPDKNNFEILKENIPYRLNNGVPAALNSALFGNECLLGISPGANSAANKVFIGGGDCSAITMNHLFELGIERVDLLRLDLNGAEVSVFSKAAEWLPKVNNILVRHWSSNASGILKAELEKGYSYTSGMYGNSHLLSRITKKY